MLNHTYKNLILEGGGVKGVAYVGALKELESQDLLNQMRRVCGVSVGSIIATIFALGYTPSEMQDIVMDLDFTKLRDSSWTSPFRLLKSYGWYKGENLRSWMGEVIKNKTGTSELLFKDMFNANNKYLDLHILGVDLTLNKTVIFSSIDTPLYKVADAVRISSGIPLVYPFIKGSKKTKDKGAVYVDGGVLNNYPINYFDNFINDNKIEDTLGLRVDNSSEIQPLTYRKKVRGLISYSKEFVNSLLNLRSKVYINSIDWKRTIYIDVKNYKTTDFSIDNSDKLNLIRLGQSSTKSYLENYNNE